MLLKVIKRIFNYIRERRFAASQSYKLHKKGTLLNAFYNSNTIFIHIPKTAGISLVNAIYGNVSNEGHRKISFYQNLFKKEIKEYYIFSFVRNPYDRLYSAFKFLEIGGMNIHDKRGYQDYLSCFNSFEDFVCNGLDESIIYKISHFIPQTEFISNKNNDIIIDFVGKYENLENDISKLSKKLGKVIELPLLNSNVNKPTYQEVYTKEMRDIVYEVYKRDFEILKY